MLDNNALIEELLWESEPTCDPEFEEAAEIFFDEEIQDMIGEALEEQRIASEGGVAISEDDGYQSISDTNLMQLFNERIGG